MEPAPPCIAAPQHLPWCTCYQSLGTTCPFFFLCTKLPTRRRAETAKNITLTGHQQTNPHLRRFRPVATSVAGVVPASNLSSVVGHADTMSLMAGSMGKMFSRPERPAPESAPSQLRLAWKRPTAACAETVVRRRFFIGRALPPWELGCVREQSVKPLESGSIAKPAPLLFHALRPPSRQTNTPSRPRRHRSLKNLGLFGV